MGMWRPEGPRKCRRAGGGGRGGPPSSTDPPATACRAARAARGAQWGSGMKDAHGRVHPPSVSVMRGGGATVMCMGPSWPCSPHSGTRRQMLGRCKQAGAARHLPEEAQLCPFHAAPLLEELRCTQAHARRRMPHVRAAVLRSKWLSIQSNTACQARLAACWGRSKGHLIYPCLRPGGGGSVRVKQQREIRASGIAARHST